MTIQNNSDDYLCADCERRFSTMLEAIEHHCPAAEARMNRFERALRMAINVFLVLVGAGLLVLFLAMIRWIEEHQ